MASIQAAEPMHPSPRLPPPARDPRSTVEDLYEHTLHAPAKAQSIEHVPADELAEAVAGIKNLETWHGIPGVTWHLDRALRSAAINLTERRNTDWSVALKPFATAVVRRQSIWSRLRQRFATCPRSRRAQKQTTLHLFALLRWSDALLHAAYPDGCNLPVKIRGLQTTRVFIEWARNEVLAHNHGWTYIKMGWMANRLRRREAACQNVFDRLNAAIIADNPAQP